MMKALDRNFLTTLSHRFGAWRRSRSGSFSLNFAVLLVPILAGIGTAVDLGKMGSAKQKLQSVSDAAVLAAANGNFTEDERTAIFNKYVQDAIDPQWGLKAVRPYVEITHVGQTVKVDGKIAANVETVMLQLAQHSGKVEAVSAAEIGKESVELVFAIDISSSMRGTRISEAKIAAKNFIDTLLTKEELEGRIHISIVPFGGTVRVPDQLSRMVADQSVLSDPNEKQHWLGRHWNGCFEHSPVDFTNDIKPSDRFDHMPDFYTWTQTNPWCPPSGSEFIPLDDNMGSLKTKIDLLQLSDGTGTDHGMAWARANLSPDWKGQFPGGKSDLPASVSEDVKKIIVLMTDGGVTGQHDVQAQHMTGTVPYKTHKFTRVKNSDAWTSFSDVCTAAKDEGTEVYTIGYIMRNATLLERLKACASSEQNHFESSSGDLDQTFDDIAAIITPLRLSH